MPKPELLLWRCHSGDENQANSQKRLQKWFQDPRHLRKQRTKHQSKAEHGDDARIAKAESHPRNPGIINALSQLGERKSSWPRKARGFRKGHVDFIRKQAGAGNSQGH